MITLLRTLTEKSKLGFGKYANRTVGELLHVKNKAYLAWIYYNASNITFTDEILTKIGIGIYADEIIPKPGKAPEKYNTHWHYTGLTGTISRFKYDSHFKKEKKLGRRAHFKGEQNQWFNKGVNAWKNQGH